MCDENKNHKCEFLEFLELEDYIQKYVLDEEFLELEEYVLDEEEIPIADWLSEIKAGKFYKTGTGQDVREPLGTVTAAAPRNIEEEPAYIRVSAERDIFKELYMNLLQSTKSA